MNFLPGRLVGGGTAVQLDAGLLVPLQTPLPGDAVIVGIRPEHLTPGGAGLSLSVDLIEPLGSETLVHGRVAGATGEIITVKLPGAIMPTETMTVAVQSDRIHVFDARTGGRIGPVSQSA